MTSLRLVLSVIMGLIVAAACLNTWTFSRVWKTWRFVVENRINSGALEAVGFAVARVLRNYVLVIAGATLLSFRVFYDLPAPFLVAAVGWLVWILTILFHIVGDAKYLYKARHLQDVRDHQDVERRATARTLATEVKATADTLAGKVEVEAKAFHDKLDTNIGLTGQAIQHADAAAKEANDVNRKISDLNERLIEQRDQKPE
jgi:hypothetical protein